MPSFHSTPVVPRKRRAAFNQAMHVVYGTAWGAPFGLLCRSPTRDGLLFGAAVWCVSLVELPLLGVAPPPWRQAPGALVSDLAFPSSTGPPPRRR